MANDLPKTAILLMGPTASGKTNLAIALSKVLPVEIINVDSAQVYIGMDIGTNKPSKAELFEFKHHLIDICLPNQPYSVAQFCNDVIKLLPEIHARSKIPLLVGGSMLYFYALCYGLSELPSADLAVRKNLIMQADKYGWRSLYDQLETIDPVAAANIMVNDRQRIQRALEVFMITGKKFSSYLSGSVSFLSGWDLQYFAIVNPDREMLYKIIANRFNSMLKNGLLDEVAELLAQQFDLSLPAMRSVGYKQLIQYLIGNLPKEIACENAITATRNLAKRQHTWLRKWQRLVEINVLDCRSNELDNLRLIKSKIKC